MKLVRQLQPSRRHSIAVIAQVTKLCVWLGIGVAVMTWRKERYFGGLYDPSDYGLAKATTERFARVAYPRWLEEHPGQHCPPLLESLSPYLPHGKLIDPWGHRYTMTCSPATGPLVVESPGEDGLYGTPDDIRSDN